MMEFLCGFCLGALFLACRRDWKIARLEADNDYLRWFAAHAVVERSVVVMPCDLPTHPNPQVN